jgi:methionyl-tRNA formyltransferase
MARAPADSPQLRLIFLGTPEFALPALRALSEGRHEVVGVITQPDRPSGRGRKLQPTPVKELATELGLPVRQPAKVGEPEVLEWMRSMRADLGVVVAFGQFIPKSVRELPTLGMINAHASLLPGDARTGISVMRVVKEMDAGDVCLVRETEIRPEENAGELGERLAELAAEALVEAVEEIAAGRAVFRSQDATRVTEAPKIGREFARLDWEEPAERILRRIRAATPRPGADLLLERAAKKLRILEARCASDAGAPPSSGAIRAEGGRLLAAAADAWVEITRLQVPGRAPVSAAEFLRGAEISIDEEVARQ